MKQHPKERKVKTVGIISPSFISYYRALFVPNHISEEEFEKMIEIYRTNLPHTFRLSNISIKVQLDQFQDTLTPITSLPGNIYKLSVDKGSLRRDPKFSALKQWLKINTDIGNCSRQEFVSMVPPYFLNVQPDSSVLDIAAAPGSKTSQIIEMLQTGYVVANEIDIKRANMLVHQLQRIGTKNVIVVSHPGESLNGFDDFRFDRVLCDVPCSGDGTSRKNPDAASNWKSNNAVSLHSTQRKILFRGLELTSEDGICVYSTCSMNPIENEAVINSVLGQLENSVEIVDVSSQFPELKRHKGLEQWVVGDPQEENFTFFSKKSEVTPGHLQHVPITCFPETTVAGLSNCMRFYPQDADSGGFFVAVLRKIKEFPKISSQDVKPRGKFREAPYLPLLDVSLDQWKTLSEYYGLKSEFPSDQLFIRNETKGQNVYFLNSEISKIIRTSSSETLRVISAGVRIFTWKKIGQNPEFPYPAFEGVRYVQKYATKQIFSLTPTEMIQLLTSGHEALPYVSLSEKTREQFSKEPTTTMGAIFYISDSDIAYGGVVLKASLSAYVGKEFIPREVDMIKHAYNIGLETKA